MISSYVKEPLELCWRKCGKAGEKNFGSKKKLIKSYRKIPSLEPLICLLEAIPREIYSLDQSCRTFYRLFYSLPRKWYLWTEQKQNHHSWLWHGPSSPCRFSGLSLFVFVCNGVDGTHPESLLYSSVDDHPPAPDEQSPFPS